MDAPEANFDRSARRIFESAIRESRCGELINALYDGGAATIDAQTGELTIVDANFVQMLGATVADDA